ncbi:MAG: 4a-hydroxytetrahydrobiopterin dehydratase [Spirochaetales bacterium]
MSGLSKESCVPCRGGEPRLTESEIGEKLREVGPWEVVERSGVNRLRRKFDFRDFKGALAFSQAVGEAAEQQGHHPRIVTQWGSVTVDWWTHAIGGLHNNDFIMAARTDAIYDT